MTVKFPSDIILLDLEYTSWEGCNENGWNEEKGEYKEIIQVAAIHVDGENFEQKRVFNKHVQPQINSKLSEYITDLTGISQRDVDEAEKFQEVIEKFREWSQDLPIYCYGHDESVILENYQLYDLDPKIDLSRFYDVRSIFSSRNIDTKNFSSGTLYTRFCSERELKTHNALEDCRSIKISLEKLAGKEE